MYRLDNTFGCEEELHLDLLREMVPVKSVYNVLKESTALLMSSLEILGIDVKGSLLGGVQRLLNEIKDYHDISLLGSTSTSSIYEELTINHNSPLHIACIIGDIDKVQKLRHFQYIDSINKDGDTPLHIACRLGHKDMCKYITEFTIGIYDEGEIHRCQSMSCWVGEGEILPTALVSKNVPSLLIKNKEHETPFKVAVKCRNFSCMNAIFSVPKVRYIISLDSRSLIPVRYYSISRPLTSFAILLGEFYKEYLEECLYIAHDFNQPYFIQIVAYLRFYQHSKNAQGLFPIETLIKNSDKEVKNIFEDIIEYNPYFWHLLLQTNYSIFSYLCNKFNLYELFKELWKDMCKRVDQEGNLLLHYICHHCNDEKIALWFSECEVNTKNKLGWTPFCEAFYRKHFSICNRLALDKQCDIYNYVDKFHNPHVFEDLCEKIHVPTINFTEVVPGDTLLHAAVTSGDNNAISFLVHCIRLDNLNSKEQYPLHLACKSGLSIELIHLLRECDVTHKDTDGNTPLDLLYKHHPNRHDFMACAMGSSHYIPGISLSPCSEEELVSTEWFRDLDFRELSKHHRLQNNALHIAVENGSLDLIEELKGDYPQLFHKFKTEKNMFDNTPLHIAASQRNLDCIKLICEECNVNAVNVNGHTYLYEACKNAKKCQRFGSSDIFK